MLLAAATVLTVAMAGSLQESQPAPREPLTTATAVRATTPPQIDGLQNEEVWAAAPKTSNFLEFDPKPSQPARFKTEFRVTYDDRNLYVFVRAFDPHPDSIMHALTRRDVRGASDQIKLIIDSYNDNRTGFQFAVNPDGV
jgi:hypothetical protein